MADDLKEPIVVQGPLPEVLPFILLATLLMGGCAAKRPVQHCVWVWSVPRDSISGVATGHEECTAMGRIARYQARATAACEKHHTPEECRALSYPSCESGNLGGQQCQ